MQESDIERQIIRAYALVQNACKRAPMPENFRAEAFAVVLSYLMVGA